MSARSRRPDPTPTETLRAAATKLRKMAADFTSATGETTGLGTELSWVADSGGTGSYAVVGYVPPAALTSIGLGMAEEVATLFATLGPTFAVLVADWLDSEAVDACECSACADGPGDDWLPLKTARYVLGEAS